MSELSDDLVRAKLKNLTGDIEEGMGVRATAFRAGRYGLSDSTASVLAELGYTVDSSVTPLTGWNLHVGLPEGVGGPDFRSHSSTPFVIAGTGAAGLLESRSLSWPPARRYAIPSLYGPYRSFHSGP